MAGGTTLVLSSPRRDPPQLRILHFNDVCHVDAGSEEPVGGFARFQTLCDHYREHATYKRQPEPLVLFSGDAFNPSIASTISKGAHMVTVLNHIKTDAACIGSHDLDFGIAQFQHLADQCEFPWLLANVLDPTLGRDAPLGRALPYIIKTTSNGLKVGVIGLVEREWLDTTNPLLANLIYKSAPATACEIASLLRQQGADIIIALTHQRESNDYELAEQIPPGTIDIILGGHNHFYAHAVVNNVHILRSGTDFKQLSYIQAWRSNIYSCQWDFAITRRDLIRSIPEDAAAKTFTDGLQHKLKARLEKPVGYTAAPLDARSTTVRLRESSYGNFVCDIMRFYYKTDCALIASGTIRGDQIYPPGILRLKDILNCFPSEDPVVVIRITGKNIRQALENGVSRYPALEGRFPQVSNVKVSFDPAATPMERIVSIAVNGVKLSDQKQYLLATQASMSRGKDGYESLRTKRNGGDAEEVVSEETGILISVLLRQYLLSLKVHGRWTNMSDRMAQHWSHVQESLHVVHPVKLPGVTVGTMTEHFEAVGQLDESDDEIDTIFAGGSAPVAVRKLSANAVKRRDDKDRRLVLARRALAHWRKVAGIYRHPDCVDEDENDSVGWAKGIAPRLEGRIIIKEF